MTYLAVLHAHSLLLPRSYDTVDAESKVRLPVLLVEHIFEARKDNVPAPKEATHKEIVRLGFRKCIIVEQICHIFVRLDKYLSQARLCQLREEKLHRVLHAVRESERL